MSLEHRTKTELIVIHHSASSPNTKMEQVIQWHINRGFETIGYHYFIEADGRIKDGRPDWAVGGHAIGANTNSIGICLAGNFEQAPPTDAQMKALANQIRYIRKLYGNIPYIGHKWVDPNKHPTACPGKLFPWENLKELLGVPDTTPSPLDAALTVLVAKGVISSPDYWKQTAPTVKYLPELLVKVADKLK